MSAEVTSQKNRKTVLNLSRPIFEPLAIGFTIKRVSQPATNSRLEFPWVCRLGTIHHYHHHLSLNREGRWGTTDDFTISFLHFSLFFTALWGLASFRTVHSLIVSSHLFLCLPCLLPPFTAPCKMVLARPNERET